MAAAISPSGALDPRGKAKARARQPAPCRRARADCANRTRQNVRHTELTHRPTSTQITATLGGLQLEGDAKGSTTIVASRAATPPDAGAGPPTLVADAQTAGAATLIMQAALPPLLMRAAAGTTMVLRGGTDVAWSPPTAHATMVRAPSAMP